MPNLPPYTPPKPNNYEEFEDGDDESYLDKEPTGEEDEEELELKRAQLKARREMLDQMENNNNINNNNNNENTKPKKRSVVESNEQIVQNPYESDESSYLIPILVAVGAFIPLLFCLCRL